MSPKEQVLHTGRIKNEVNTTKDKAFIKVTNFSRADEITKTGILTTVNT